MPFHSGISSAIGGFFGGVRDFGRSTVGGIFDRIGLGAPPPQITRQSVGAGPLRSNVNRPFEPPGSLQTTPMGLGALTGLVNPRISPSLGDRFGQALTDLGSGLSGIAAEAATGFLTSLIPRPVLVDPSTGRRGGGGQASRVEPTTQTATSEQTRAERKFVLGSTGVSGSQIGEAGILGGLFGVGVGIAAEAGLDAIIDAVQTDDHGMDIETGRPPMGRHLAATATPGGAVVVGQSGGFLGFGQSGGVTLPSGGFFFGASQNMATGAITVRPKNHLRIPNPATGETVHWLRAIPPPLRKWKIAGRRRARRP